MSVAKGVVVRISFTFLTLSGLNSTDDGMYAIQWSRGRENSGTTEYFQASNSTVDLRGVMETIPRSVIPMKGTGPQPKSLKLTILRQEGARVLSVAAGKITLEYESVSHVASTVICAPTIQENGKPHSVVSGSLSVQLNLHITAILGDSADAMQTFTPESVSIEQLLRQYNDNRRRLEFADHEIARASLATSPLGTSPPVPEATSSAKSSAAVMEDPSALLKQCDPSCAVM